MSFGTRRSDGGFDALGAKPLAGLVTRARTMGVGRPAAVVRAADGVAGTGRVAVGDERLGDLEVMESVGFGDVGDDAGSGAGDDRCAPAPDEPAAPAQPATRIESTTAPARERAAYRRVCLTTTYASERSDAERSTLR